MFGSVQSQWISYLSGLTEDTILLYYSAWLSLTVISSAPKASWVSMYTMNNHTYNGLTTD